jgi:hypothetical protein
MSGGLVCVEHLLTAIATRNDHLGLDKKEKRMQGYEGDKAEAQSREQEAAIVEPKSD